MLLNKQLRKTTVKSHLKWHFLPFPLRNLICFTNGTYIHRRRAIFVFSFISLFINPCRRNVNTVGTGERVESIPKNILERDKYFYPGRICGICDNRRLSSTCLIFINYRSPVYECSRVRMSNVADRRFFQVKRFNFSNFY